MFALILFASAAFAETLVNINTADLETLETLNGIGPSKAQAIIDYRTEHGPFAAKEDIMNVSGIGTATYDKIKDFITVDDGESQAPPPQEEQQQAQPATSTETSTPTNPPPVPNPVSSYVPPPSPVIFADAGADRVVIVGADTEFDARAYDKQQNDVQKVRYMWNFGDGSTAEGAHVLHHYSYPGRYAVFLDIAHERDAASDQIIVTAEPARLGFTANPDGSVTIENDAGHDLDLSNWIVRQFAQTFTLPAHSVILIGQSMRISQTTLGFWAGASAELQYPNGVLALRTGEHTKRAAPLEEGTPAATAPIAAVSSQETSRTVVSAPAQPSYAPAPASESAEVAGEGDPAPLLAQEAAVASVDFPSKWWLAAIALSALTCVALVAARMSKKKEWDIVEEKG